MTDAGMCDIFVELAKRGMLAACNLVVQVCLQVGCVTSLRVCFATKLGCRYCVPQMMRMIK